ncbi:MAG TPA: glutathionylspermidine synthase family protein [Kofleriaceae bacterium]
MRRRVVAPRPDWQARVEAEGLVFHTAADHGPYWGEGTYYELTGGEADAIEAATAELHARCLDAVAHVIARGRYAELGIPPSIVPLIERSWEGRAPTLYGRMDLAFGDGVPRLLEYNADTPTSLLEAGVIQWTWLAACFPARDQLNTIHERLIATWRALGPRLGGALHVAAVDDLEDAMTVGYLRDTAEQAGLATCGLLVEELGWDACESALVDLDGRPIASLFKLYPWEGLVADELGPLLPSIPVTWIEPAWKMILSNKAILPILWELFPGHPNLLAAGHAPPEGAWVKKPLLGREGANVSIRAPGVEVDVPGPYDDAGFVYQAYADLGEHDGMRPVIGSWVIGDRPAGIGIRETPGYVTGNTARFVPHVVDA